MDLRSLYLQELLQVQDFLTMQRNIVKALGVLSSALFGANTVVTTIPPGGSPSNPGGMNVTVPAIAIYQVDVVDLNTWPQASVGIPVLGADSFQAIMQGINFGTTNLSLPAATGDDQFYLIQAKIGPASDTTNVVLPYFPIVQLTTVAGSSTTVIHTQEHPAASGVSVGDKILVQGISTVSGAPATVTATDDTLNTITINGADPLTSAPGATIPVRDVTPNNGAPLSGPGNSGVAQPVDRVRRVILQIKQGVPGGGPVGTPDAGFVPLWNLRVLLATDGTWTTDGLASNAPFFPTLVGTHHHRGIPGHASKITMTGALETDFEPVNRAGDIMLGDLTVPHLKVGVPPSGALQATLLDNLQLVENLDPITSFQIDFAKPTWLINLGNHLTDSASIWRSKGMGAPSTPVSLVELLTLVSTAGLMNDATPDTTNLMLGARRVVRFATGTYVGSNTLSRAITVGFGPVLVLVMSAATSAEFSALLYGTNLGAQVAVDNLQGINLKLLEDNTGVWGGLSGTGFITSTTVATHLNNGGITYRWFALG